jgi:hypothetical protein
MDLQNFFMEFILSLFDGLMDVVTFRRWSQIRGDERIALLK